MLRKIKIAALALVIAGGIGCSTDVELNAPYKSQTIVFGLLDTQVDTQWVKVNRTWLGDGNNLDYALIQDSSEYQEEEFVGVVNELLNGNVANSYTLIDTLLDNKDEDGIFFGPQHKAYYILTPNGLNDDAIYQVSLDFVAKEDVSSVTNIISSVPGSITFPPQGNPNFKLNWATVDNLSNINYSDPIFKWSSTANASRYEASLNIYLTEHVWSDIEHTQLVSSTPRILEWFVGNESASSGNGGEVINLKVEGIGLFRFLETRLTPDPFVTRSFGIYNEENQFSHGFDFVLTIANEDLDTYLSINEPITNIVQERPEFTNVINGLGLWASRSTEVATKVGYSTGTMRALRQSEITSALNFCSSNPFDGDLSCD
ncbi:MAG: hypothetical protein ACI80P_000838 [Flavobacteriales bacterium]|jgi:hypothetical protein